MTEETIEQKIRIGAGALGQQLPPDAAGKLARLLAELSRWGRRVNLTAIRTPEAMLSGHILDSLSVRPLLHGRRVIDVGTGAGFPGLPLAIAEPELEFVLLDSNQKKIAFVQHMIAELRLANAAAVRVRAEDYAPVKRFDTVIARALAATPRLIELAGHLVERGGVLLAQKGKHPAAELEALQSLPEKWEYTVTELKVPGIAEHARHVISLHRAEPS